MTRTLINQFYTFYAQIGFVTVAERQLQHIQALTDPFVFLFRSSAYGRAQYVFIQVMLVSLMLID